MQRLERIIASVPDAACVADIACDHAYVATELVRRGKAERAIACDLRTGPLQRAREAIERAGLSDVIETRLGDGLSPVRAGEADVVVLSGIGGDLMVRILSGRLRDFPCFILSPHSMCGAVRRFLYKEGMEITAEEMLRERGKYYLILTVRQMPYPINEEVKKADIIKRGESYVFTYGYQLLLRRDEVLFEYLLREKQRFEEILKQSEQPRLRRAYQDCLCALEVYQ